MMKPRRTERGAVIVLSALIMVALIGMAAIVVDLASTRSVRRDARSAADAGASAGALALTNATNATTACADSLAYTFFNLGGTQPTATQISTACAGMTATCTTGGAARVASLTVGSTTVKFTNPVPDTSPLMNAGAVGGAVTQSVNTTNDGTDCQRVGIEIIRPQSRFFGGVLTGSTSNFNIHSVARSGSPPRPGDRPPGLVALNQTVCKSIDAGNNGQIVLKATSAGPGIAYSDSNGTASSCGTNPILNSTSAGRLIAEMSGSTPGELAWYAAAASRGYASSSSTTTLGVEGSTSNYVGKLYARDTRITRVPVDKVYHCTNVPVSVQPLCTTTDPIQDAQTLAAAATAPAGFTTWSAATGQPCDSTGGTVTMGAANAKIWVDCPLFSVKGNPLVIPGGGTIIFHGKLEIVAGGTIAVNTSTTPSSGYPVATNSSLQTTLIVTSTASDAIHIQANSARVLMAQTTLYNAGGFDLQATETIRWTPPSTTTSKGLLYWSETTQQFHLQGGPTIFASGVLFNGNGPLTASGNGVIDLTNVQAWVNTASLSGTPVLRLAPDPNNSIRVAGAGTELIR
jgi:Flp pilus assembly protein TadG